MPEIDELKKNGDSHGEFESDDGGWEPDEPDEGDGDDKSGYTGKLYGEVTDESLGLTDQPTDRPANQPERKRGRPRTRARDAAGRPIRKRSGGKPGRPFASRESEDSRYRFSDKKLEHFPKPTCYHFHDDKPGRERKPSAFFDYIKKRSTDPEYRDRMALYVYRIWPIMRPDSKQIEKTADVFAYSDIPQRYGVGDYHFKLNDAGLRKPIAMCTAKGFRDEKFPAILNHSLVDMTDPLNQSFIERARANGIRFPGEAEKESEESAMAEVRAMDTLTSALVNQTDKVMQMAEKRDKQPQGPVNVDHEAMSRGLGIVAEAAAMGNTMLQNAINKVTDQTAKQVDPMAVLTQTMAMAKDMMQTANARESVVGAVQANDHSQIIEIMKMQQDQQTKFHDTLFQMQQGQIAELKAALANNQSNNTMLQVGTSQPKTLIEQINEMKAVKDTMREVLGLGDEVADKGSWWQDNMPMIVQGLSVLGSVISTGLYNLAVIKSGQGAPQVPPGPEAVLTEEQQEEMRSRGIPVGGHPPMNQQSPPQQPVGTQPTMEGGDMFAQYHAFLGMIKIPILKSFQDGESGDEFAEKLMLLGDNGHFGENLQGRQVYDMVVSNGKPTIMALIKTYPPIWNVVQLTPAKWEKFMTDFFDAERLLKEKWEEEEQEGGSLGANGEPINQ